MFLESVRDFKDIYYLVKLVSREAFDSMFEREIVVDEDGNMLYDDIGNEETKLVSKLPLHWIEGYFQKGTYRYLTRPDDLDSKDKDSYGTTVKFVDGFVPTKWETRNRESFLDDDGQY